jgi:hypothetical protein
VPPVPGKAAPTPQKTGMTFVPESWRTPPPPAGASSGNLVKIFQPEPPPPGTENRET